VCTLSTAPVASTYQNLRFAGVALDVGYRFLNFRSEIGGADRVNICMRAIKLRFDLSMSRASSPTMNRFATFLFAITFSSITAAQAIDTPVVKPGDTWTYESTVETGSSGWTKTKNEITVSRVTGSTIYLSSKQSGSTQAARERFVGSDWSRVRNVNGKETVVALPMAFPMSVGKTWELAYTEDHPNKNHKFEQWNTKYVVVGYETVEVPAGKFQALKIEAEGHWTAELESSNRVVQGANSTPGNTTMITQVQRTAATSATGRIYKACWYAPEVKRWVRSVDEYYGSDGVRNERYTDELDSFKVGQ
jgi:hypothetical protein